MGGTIRHHPPQNMGGTIRQSHHPPIRHPPWDICGTIRPQPIPVQTPIVPDAV